MTEAEHPQPRFGRVTSGVKMAPRIEFSGRSQAFHSSFHQCERNTFLVATIECPAPPHFLEFLGANKTRSLKISHTCCLLAIHESIINQRDLDWDKTSGFQGIQKLPIPLNRPTPQPTGRNSKNILLANRWCFL